MRAGRLDRQITIETVTEARDEFGSVTESWATWKTVWANVIPMNAQERFLSESKRSVRVNKFRIRYIEGLLNTMRIKYEGLIYNITGIAELGRFDGYEIVGEAVT